MLKLADITVFDAVHHFVVRLPAEETRGLEVDAHVEYEATADGCADIRVWLQCDSVTEFERFLATVFQVKTEGRFESRIVDQLRGDRVFEENLYKLLDLIGTGEAQ